mmetsp:Transcript_37791/g.108684  ORF Transcript_37791/g.108684 Transcript_37791/m.108684 type:complete len:260 (-) Transcript_37791:3-782(-)
MASASTPPFTPRYSQRKQPSRSQCGASGQGTVSRSSVANGSRRRCSCETIQPKERSCSRRKGHSAKCGGCVCAASSTLLRMENSPTGVAVSGRSAGACTRLGSAADVSTMRQVNCAAGSAQPRRSIRWSSTPGRTSMRSCRNFGCICTIHGSSSPNGAPSAAPSRGTFNVGCHSVAAWGTCSSRPCGNGSKTECSCRLEAKKQRVPRASFRPVKSSHSSGNWPKIAWPDGSSGTSTASSGTAAPKSERAAGGGRPAQNE